jgi:hypothetical protein
MAGTAAGNPKLPLRHRSLPHASTDNFVAIRCRSLPARHTHWEFKLKRLPHALGYDPSGSALLALRLQSPATFEGSALHFFFRYSSAARFVSSGVGNRFPFSSLHRLHDITTFFRNPFS